MKINKEKIQGWANSILKQLMLGGYRLSIWGCKAFYWLSAGCDRMSYWLEARLEKRYGISTYVLPGCCCENCSDEEEDDYE